MTPEWHSKKGDINPVAVIPVVGCRYKPIEGRVTGVIQMIDFKDNIVTISVNEGRIVHTIPWTRFCEYWEAVPEEAVAP